MALTELISRTKEFVKEVILVFHLPSPSPQSPQQMFQRACAVRRLNILRTSVECALVHKRTARCKQPIRNHTTRRPRPIIRHLSSINVLFVDVRWQSRGLYRSWRGWSEPVAPLSRFGVNRCTKKYGRDRANGITPYTEKYCKTRPMKLERAWDRRSKIHMGAYCVRVLAQGLDASSKFDLWYAHGTRHVSEPKPKCREDSEITDLIVDYLGVTADSQQLL